jgi:hypothetical protein
LIIDNIRTADEGMIRIRRGIGRHEALNRINAILKKDKTDRWHFVRLDRQDQQLIQDFGSFQTRNAITSKDILIIRDAHPALG